MLRAYIDDAGTHADSRITVAAAVVAPEASWENLERRWAQKLLNPLPGKPALSKFHLSNCQARAREFAGYSAAETDALTHDFRQIMIDAAVISTAAAVDRVAWDELIVGDQRIALGDALQAAFVQCMDRICSIASDHPGEGIVHITIDKGIETGRLSEIADLYARHVGGRPWIRCVQFSPVIDTLPLQAADVIATETYWQGLKWLDEGADANARAHFKNWISSSLSEGYIMDRSEIEANVLGRR